VQAAENIQYQMTQHYIERAITSQRLSPNKDLSPREKDHRQFLDV